MLGVILSLIRSKIRRRKASPIVEEGLLIGLALIMLALLLSIVSGLFGYLRNVVNSVGAASGSVWQKIMGDFDRIWNAIKGMFGG